LDKEGPNSNLSWDNIFRNKFIALFKDAYLHYY